jgi:hypothetical protein
MTCLQVLPAEIALNGFHYAMMAMPVKCLVTQGAAEQKPFGGVQKPPSMHNDRHVAFISPSVSALTTSKSSAPRKATQD